MLNRFWAFILILICGVNAIGVSGFAYLSEKKAESVSVACHDESLQQSTATTDCNSISSATHFPGDGHEGDCGDTHQTTHACHLGHCTFLMTTVAEVVTPNRLEAYLSLPKFSFLSADLSAPNKPPRA